MEICVEKTGQKKCPLPGMRMEMWAKDKCNQLIPKNLFVI